MTTAVSLRRPTGRAVAQPTRVGALLTALFCVALCALLTACAPPDTDVPPCAPAAVPFSAYLGDRIQPPWASRWVEQTLAAGAEVSAPLGAATDDELIAMTLACAGLSDNDSTVTRLTDQPSTVTIGTSPYLYTARGVRTTSGSFIVGVAVERTDDGSARFGLKPTEMIGDLPIEAPPATAMVQWLREDRVL
ncbi:hypothetical protein HQ325_16645 [Rhodococcus sp. BP-349]|uniref:hypothetical protein n=1 Tax=unclassified Rhodococcus (in: high G+C Gram-positive bacteria) TaxID=192944 RepID=UPI001C9A9F48|nr:MULTISPECIES: hypothetical protein [unclassified Rhodococcus (in: high G+C Gram-positive bacteria)]MBY6540304.1 hypothetical protein [Rhodococcus sp. BP-363]MBY6545671.1 hypothetical protein [Rhodococcus sp. BP-369]MBY6564901.1 hypothetical protein [Rhodococcus sp. BP-370]MBY6578163.1 hypothetical protein [Rhodococcus sp. BP-364]MBY6587464.1 hypothetical protein [Rhodococcus sp. BP-358]